MQSIIYVSDIFTNLQPLTEYKIHFAKGDPNEPPDAYMRDFSEWEWWNRFSNGKSLRTKRHLTEMERLYRKRSRR